MKNLFYILFLLTIPITLNAQKDSLESKVVFNSDFRFRSEQDWDSKKSNGTYREDRTRLRYRVRAGFTYQHNKWASFGIRARTGNPKKQQDPQLTLGNGSKEFGTLPIALEKAYFKGKKKNISFWLGKNSFPFKKQNELFWSDNVYPEGVFIQKNFSTSSNFLSQLAVNGGHFIMNTRGKTLMADTYFQGFQLVTSFNELFNLFPAIYIFKNVQNIPDGGETYYLDYTIIHIGSSVKLSKSPLIQLEADYHYNIENYSNTDSIPTPLRDQNTGLVVALNYGQLKEKGDWKFKVSYTEMQRYAAVDFMAQNDWARWDYSSLGSPDGRLTNFKGVELVAGYNLEKNLSLKIKYYLVEELINLGTTKETGNRVRLDLDINF